MITQVRLTNFKSFRDTEDVTEGTTVDLASFTLVLGSNGAGKSNFFDALRLLRSIGERRSVRDALEGHALPGALGTAVAGVRGGAASIPHQGSASPVFRLEVHMLLDGVEHEYVVRVDALRHRVIAEQLVKAGHPGDYVFATPDDRRPRLPQHPRRQPEVGVLPAGVPARPAAHPPWRHRAERRRRRGRPR